MSLGALGLRDYPNIFGIYIFLSRSSFHLIRDNPNTLWIYLLHNCSIVFRNLFIVPALGYTLIININSFKQELLKQDIESKNREFFNIDIPLFLNTPLLENQRFTLNLLNWSSWISQLKPSIKSLRKTSVISMSTTTFWKGIILYTQKITYIVKVFSRNQVTFKDRKERIKKNDCLDLNEKQVITTIAQNISKHMQELEQKFQLYQEMSFYSLRFYFIFHKNLIYDILNQSFDLLRISIDLDFCTKVKNKETQQLLYKLTKEYAPDSLPIFEKIVYQNNVINQASQIDPSENGMFLGLKKIVFSFFFFKEPYFGIFSKY